jgi:hypothetical protein
VPFPSTCKDAPFKFSVNLPEKPLKIEWFLNNTSGILKKIDGSIALKTKYG